MHQTRARVTGRNEGRGERVGAIKRFQEIHNKIPLGLLRSLPCCIRRPDLVIEKVL